MPPGSSAAPGLAGRGGVARRRRGARLDPILDLDKGLPSAAGTNAATMAGSAYTAPASLIRKYIG